MSTSSARKNDSVTLTKREISAEKISKTLDEFGSGPPYEFQTRASRRRYGKSVLKPHEKLTSLRKLKMALPAMNA